MQVPRPPLVLASWKVPSFRWLVGVSALVTGVSASWLTAVLGATPHLRSALWLARGGQCLQDARHRATSERTRRHDGDGFRGGVIDDREALQHAALSGAVEDEVRRPHLVRCLGPAERLPVGQRHLLPASAPHLQPRLRVESIDPLMIDPTAFLTQIHVDHAGATPSVAMR